jgi:hypothetical protein
LRNKICEIGKRTHVALNKEDVSRRWSWSSFLRAWYWSKIGWSRLKHFIAEFEFTESMNEMLILDYTFKPGCEAGNCFPISSFKDKLERIFEDSCEFKIRNGN